MNNATHTPGPWVVRPDLSIETGQSGITIAGLVDMPADAHLIAAAPAMYEALQMVATTLYDMADSAGDVPEWNESGELYELSRTVRAALAQAEGSKP
jgi:hypothetical protein